MTCQGLPLAKPDRILFTVRGSQFTVRHTRPVERPQTSGGDEPLTITASREPRTANSLGNSGLILAK
jgi:hypothetical protein